MSKQYQSAVYVGRFQPFHNAHLKTVLKALEIADNVIIAVGSAVRPRTPKNPHSAEDRIRMIRLALSEALNIPQTWTNGLGELEKRVKFIELRDHMYNNNKWCTELYTKAQLVGAAADEKTCLIGHFKDDSSFYLKMFPQWSLMSVPNYKNINATDVRLDFFENGKLTEKSEGLLPPSIFKRYEIPSFIIDEHNFEIEYKKRHRYADPKITYEPVALAADAVVIKSGHILLIKRGFNPGKGQWALPGGHLDPGEIWDQTAIRELKEETRIDVPKEILKRSIVEQHIFDHPNRSSRCRVVTQAYTIDLGNGPLPSIKAGDDAKGARWVPLADLYKYQNLMFEDHGDIIQRMTSRY